MLNLPSVQKQTIINILSGKTETFASVLLSALLIMYGAEVLNWDGITIQMQVKDDLDVDMPRGVYDKIMALITVITTDSVYKDPYVFDTYVTAVNGGAITSDQDPPTVDDVAWAVMELRYTDPEPITRDPNDPWSGQVKKYVRAVLDSEGMDVAPKILEFAGDKVVGATNPEDYTLYAGEYASKQLQAEEVDQWLQAQVQLLAEALVNLGAAK